MKKRKKLLLFISIIVLIIFIIILVFYYKSNKNGNTMINKSEEEIINNILNIKTYNAKLNIEIQTNNNKTQYVVNQHLDNGIAKQEVIEPSNISGVITEYDGTNLIIKNNKLDLETTFQNYQYIVTNRLWLDSFINEYKNEENKTKSGIEKNEIVLELKTNETKYNVYKKLYIDKTTGKPTKLIVKDINQKTLVYILYKEITISI